MRGGVTATLPMFPLGSVLVPHAALPLHVFEPRYRALMHDIMDGDRRFGVVLISAGHEVGGEDRRTDIGTVAQVVDARRLEDGRWALVAAGTQRLRVREWLPDDPYPRADVDLLEDPAPGGDAAVLRDEVDSALRRVLARASELGDTVAPATTEISADPLVASYHALSLTPIGPLDRQRLLDIDEPEARLRGILSVLAELEHDLELRLRLETSE